jgi:hypothetical protein
MKDMVLGTFDFRKPAGGWRWPLVDAAGIQPTPRGCLATAAPREQVHVSGSGVHTRNGDNIELHFEPLQPSKGRLLLYYSGGFEHIHIALDFARRCVAISTSEWNRRQPIATAPLPRLRRGPHVLRVTKREGTGGLVKMADLDVCLDDRLILQATGLDALPEMGVGVGVEGTSVLLRRFVHRGRPTGIPEYLHIGGWQMLNQPSIDANLQSLERGIRMASDRGVQLLVTPETSLTGLFQSHPVTQKREPIEAAEQKLCRLLRGVRNAPHLVVGLPVWHREGGRDVRYNGLRGRKIHSCEQDFWHGRQLHEFTVCGVPISMHICHDIRYPEVWTLPIMFGARVVIHPSNSGPFSGTVDAFEASNRPITSTMHAFYLRVNGGGGSCLLSPEKGNNILAVSDECRRDPPAFPQVGEPRECLMDARIRVHDAFGYWPMRSFRASEAVAAAYVELYRSLGGGATPVA